MNEVTVFLPEHFKDFLRMGVVFGKDDALADLAAVLCLEAVGILAVHK